VLGCGPVLVEDVPPDALLTAILVDNQDLVRCGILKHSILILDMSADPFVEGQQVAVRCRGEDGFRYMEFLRQNTTSLRLLDLGEDQVFTFRLSQLAQMHAVHMTSLPQ